MRILRLTCAILALTMCTRALAGGSPERPPKPPVGGRPSGGAQARLYRYPRTYPVRVLDRRALARAAAILQRWQDSTRTQTVTELMGPCAWHSAGPTNLNGRVTGLAVDPSNPLRVFASTVGGLWRSDDEAKTWARVSDQFGAVCVGAVAVAPGNSSLVVAGQGDPNNDVPGLGWATSGIWVSTSGGDPGSWTRIAPPDLADAIVTRIRIGPGADPDVYVATSAGVFLGKVSASATFTRVGTLSDGVSDLAIDFGASPPTLYAAVSTSPTPNRVGVWKHSAVWAQLSSGYASNPGVAALALAPSDPHVLYAKVAHPNGTFAGLFRRGSSGGWVKKSGPDDATSPLANADDGGAEYNAYNCVVEVDPGDANRVYVGGLSMWFTPDASASAPDWLPMDKPGADPAYDDAVPHADQHAIALLAGSPRRLLVGNDGGIDLGIERVGSDGQPNGTYQWADRSHGMTITQFYGVATQDSPTPATAGGSQDNGSELTFGNRTWYATAPKCDGGAVGLDPGPSSTLYQFCTWDDCSDNTMSEAPNPLDITHPTALGIEMTFPPGSPAGSPSGSPSPPIATGRPTPSSPAGNAMVAACVPGSTPRLWFTTTGVAWDLVEGSILPDRDDRITSLAVGPARGWQRIYMGYAGSSPTGASAIWSRDVTPNTPDWVRTQLPPPGLPPNAIAADPNVATTAYAALGGDDGAGGMKGALLGTTDGGRTWTSFDGRNSDAAYASPLTGVVVDPANANVLYVASTVGVFRVDGSTGGLVHADWTPLTNGLPAGIDITSLALNQGRRKLVLGTFGYGAYTYDLDATSCPLVALNVRDNVFDDGSAPTSSGGIPDPEHPIADSGRPPDAAGTRFFVARTNPTDMLYWWMSPDIRLHRFDDQRKQNELAWVDNVGVETCPIDCADCPSGTNVDQQLHRNDTDSVFVQVTNRGTKTATNVRVCALWGDASTAVPMLPGNFWTTVFPTAGDCAAPDPTSGWHAFDATCVRVGNVAADHTAVATFRWQVPASAPDHSCVIAFVESDEDPIPSRAANELRPWVLVPSDAHVGQRNLHIVDTMSAMAVTATAESLDVVNPTSSSTPLDLDWSRASLPDSAQLALLLPRDSSMVLTGFTKVSGPIHFGGGGHVLPTAPPAGLDTTAVYLVTSPDARIRGFHLAPGQRRAIYFAVSTTTPLPRRGSARFSVLERQGKLLLGGSTYVLRGRAR